MNDKTKLHKIEALKNSIKLYLNYSLLGEPFESVLKESMKKELQGFLYVLHGELAESVCMYVESKKYIEAMDALENMTHQLVETL